MCLLGFTCETSSEIEEKDHPSPTILVTRMMDNLYVTVSPETLQDSVQLYTCTARSARLKMLTFLIDWFTRA